MKGFIYNKSAEVEVVRCYQCEADIPGGEAIWYKDRESDLYRLSCPFVALCRHCDKVVSDQMTGCYFDRHTPMETEEGSWGEEAPPERYQVVPVYASHSLALCRYTVYDRQLERYIVASTRKMAAANICRLLNKQELVPCE